MTDQPSDPRLLPDLTLRYADHTVGEDGVVDVHLPGGSRPATGGRADGSPPAPLVVYVHGGFWRTAFDRRHARPLARALADEGAVVASVEYRRVGEGAGGGWPATGDDVRRAVDALPGLLTEVGVHTGPTRLVGHSAGGHLVLWLVATGATCERVVPLAPVCDLGEATRRHLGDGATADLMGGQDPAVADPMVLLHDTPVPADRPVATIVHGRADDVVPLPLSEGLVEAHPWIGLEVVEGDHMDVIDPTSAVWPVVRRAVLG
ncbi:MAG: alpha/beta hydrolase [Marmoricola sp.]|nr:alpha/beta hydrolase [Marmoricola sp.]